jgi:peptide/nickel transport system ATP-binding protein
MVMYAGQIVESGNAEEMVFNPVHPYSKGLMGSIIVPESGIREHKLTAIPGTPPNLKNPPSGCRFADRCKYLTSDCRVNSVGIRDFGSGRSYRCFRDVDKLKEVYANE